MSMSLEAELPTRELRCSERLPLGRRAWCEHRDWTLYLAVVNVSAGGMFIQTSTGFSAGERLLVCLRERDLRMVTEVEVVWSKVLKRKAGIGCRVTGFAEGAEHYWRLLEQLRENSR
jgi:Tfp pilus assembly protein PilZ